MVFVRQDHRLIPVVRLHDPVARAEDGADELPQVFVVLADEDRFRFATVHGRLSV
jgi:hypothetical protein